MINKPRGTNDSFGKKIRIYQALNERFRSLLATYNYQELETPIFEPREVFVRGVGSDSDIVSKEMYEFYDRKNRAFVLRPEGTSGVVRAIIENKLYVQNNLPIKVFYTGPMFRYERPQLGRTRQFNQFGIEVFGVDSPAQDFEVLTIAMQFMETFGMDDRAMIHINYLITGTKREEYLKELTTYLRTVPDLCADCQIRIDTNPLRVLDCKVDQEKLTNVPDMQTYLTEEEKTYFQQVTWWLSELNYQVIVDNKLVRGLDYYTGIVFEIKYAGSLAFKELTLIGGGRYNNLVQQLDGPELSAVGFGVGIDRVVSILETRSFATQFKDVVDVYVGMLGDFSMEKWRFVNSLRTLGLKVETNLVNQNLKQIFKAAEKYHAKKIIILGDEEVQNQSVKIKDQETGLEISRQFNALAIEDF